ncbi:catechol 2,3-dioxygenase-like lactoylglutathione lyase family enzyme [Nocardia transvalensis]|uniref:Catechol 2,3-dioxygenase-like lactoylglutathione lyase family enzyme n=1 Tax=Nocardia transvalensis TaxID=37333 RepID=A0A7W9UKE8_9NOCA|nr:VOC family protein [Nocardia transvalensis]MBB5916473.1 catechol 2,3-dioxygenase-like lactoylglutathione lyase family enzyme [Nocardia transvalensis]
MGIAQLGLITLNCADETALAAFWAAMLGGEIVYRDDNVAVVHTTRGVLATVRVQDYAPPTWPGGDTPNNQHLDLVVDDLDSGERESVHLGARRADRQPQPDRWRVLLDPAGHPFCLTTHLPLLPLGPHA